MHIMLWRKIPLDTKIGEVGTDSPTDANRGVRCRRLGRPRNLRVGVHLSDRLGFGVPEQCLLPSTERGKCFKTSLFEGREILAFVHCSLGLTIVTSRSLTQNLLLQHYVWNTN